MFKNYKNIPILFIGSGFSKRYLEGYPDWKELLEQSIKTFDNKKYAKESISKDFEKLSEFESNTKLATVIEKRFNEKFYERKLDISEVAKEYLEKVYDENKTSPFKIYLSMLFSNIEYKEDEKLKQELEAFKELSKNNLLSIVTTNYDSLIKDLLPNYEELSGKELILGEPENSILKIHGSVNNIPSIIFTENDYKKFKNTNKIIQAKLLTYFLDRPIIFLGYSLTDENIKNIIIDIFKTLDYSDAEYKKIENNFIFIEYKKGENECEINMNSPLQIENVTIHINKIETDNYLKIFEELKKIEVKTDVKTIKKFKSLIKTLVSDNSAVNSKMLVKEKDLDKMKKEEIVVGFGVAKGEVKVVGFDFNLNQMLKYVFEKEKDQLMTSKEIFKSYYILKKNHGSNTRFPIYKLMNDISKDKTLDFNNFTLEYEAIIKKYQQKYKRLLQEIENIDKNNCKDTTSKEKKYLLICKKYLDDELDDKEFFKYLHACEKEIHRKKLILIYDYKNFK